MLARIFHEMSLRDREDGSATGQPQGVGPEAYLSSTSQGPTPEDARKDGHIIRARCAPLSPASGFPVSRSQQMIREICGLYAIYQQNSKKSFDNNHSLWSRLPVKNPDPKGLPTAPWKGLQNWIQSPRSALRVQLSAIKSLII